MSDLALEDRLRALRPQIRMSFEPNCYWLVTYIPPFWTGWKMFGNLRALDKEMYQGRTLIDLLEDIRPVSRLHDG